MTEQKGPISKRFNNLKINPEATADFNLHQDEGSNPMRVALNEQGEKVLLKTAIAFEEEGEPNATTSLSVDNLKKYLNTFPSSGYRPSFEDEYYENTDTLFVEEQASRLAQHLGIRSPEAKLVFIDEVPFIAYEYLEGAKDTSFGIRIQISKDAQIREQQEGAMARGALLKTLLRAEDDGQFLQVGETGEIVLSDIGARNLQTIKSEADFQKELRHFFIPRSDENLAHQIAGTRGEEFGKLLQKISELDYDGVLKLIARDQKKPTDREKARAAAIISRKDYVVKLFNNIRNSPREMMQKILDLQNGIS